MSDMTVDNQTLYLVTAVIFVCDGRGDAAAGSRVAKALFTRFVVHTLTSQCDFTSNFFLISFEREAYTSDYEFLQVYLFLSLSIFF